MNKSQNQLFTDFGIFFFFSFFLSKAITMNSVDQFPYFFLYVQANNLGFILSTRLILWDQWLLRYLELKPSCSLNFGVPKRATDDFSKFYNVGKIHSISLFSSRKCKNLAISLLWWLQFYRSTFSFCVTKKTEKLFFRAWYFFSYCLFNVHKLKRH